MACFSKVKTRVEVIDESKKNKCWVYNRAFSGIGTFTNHLVEKHNKVGMKCPGCFENLLHTPTFTIHKSGCQIYKADVQALI